jgi:hypothetical protein
MKQKIELRINSLSMNSILARCVKLKCDDAANNDSLNVGCSKFEISMEDSSQYFLFFLFCEIR